jgi:GntR family transcriptional regulator
LPYYQQLKGLIVAHIERDGLQPGDLLPSEAELCQQHRVSRTVVRQAIGDLVSEGLLTRMRGKGTFVARPKLREQFMESTVGFFEDLTAHGRGVSNQVLSVDLVEASPHIAEALGLAVTSRVIELVRLRSVNDESLALTKSYLNSSSEDLLKDLCRANLARTSLYRFLEDRWNLRIESGQRSLGATKAKGMVARLLQVRSGEPVLHIESTARDGLGNALEYFEAWHRADRTRLEMNLVREQRPLAAGFARVPQ